MKANSGPKFYSFLHFYQLMDWKNKAVFWLVLLALLGAAVATVRTSSDPSRLVVNITEVSDEKAQEVLIRQESANFREFEQRMPAYQEMVSFTAGPMTPVPWTVLVFVVLQVLGWSVFLAASTRVKSWWPYLIYVVLIMHLFFSGLGQKLFPGNELLGASLVIMPILILCGLFQQEILKFNLLVRTLLFGAVYGGAMGYLYSEQGWLGLHEVTANSFPVLGVIVLLWLFFTAHEYTNLALLLATNHKNKKRRSGLIGFAVIFTLFFLIQFVLFQEAADLNIFKLNIGLRPVHLLAGLAILSMFTQQNFYPVVREKFQGNAAFTLLLGGLALICLSTVFFHSAVGEYLFLRLAERHAIIFMTLSGLFYFFFVAGNHTGRLRDKDNFYFIARKNPKKLMYFFVVIATVLVSFALEMKDNKKTVKLSYTIALNRQGDHAMLQDSTEKAIRCYKDATFFTPGAVKANYNLAYLMLKDPLARTNAPEYYLKSWQAYPFPFGALNHGNFLNAIGERDQAKAIFREFLEIKPNALIANNLGMIYRRENRPDSVITYLKKGLLMDYNRPSLYSNLALTYMENNKVEVGKDFLQAGLDLKTPPSRALVTNAGFYRLAYGDSLSIPPTAWQSPAVKGELLPNMNYALALFKEGKYGETQAILDQLMEIGESMGVLVLDGILKFRKGNIEDAVSRMEYVIASSPQNFGKYANHFLAVEFAKADAPEMAAEYFRQAGEAGMERDFLNAALMELDAGNHDLAQNQMNLFRVLYPNLWDDIGKELGMLLRAYGQGNLAYTEWDFEGMTFNEAIRIGLYAGQSGSRLTVLESFLQAIEMDSSSVVPYVEMSRINLRDEDPIIFENLAAGLAKAPENVDLAVLKGRAHLNFGEKETGIGLAESLRQKHPDNFEVKLLYAEALLSKADTATALPLLEKMHKDRPLDTRVLRTMGEVLRKQKKTIEGYQLFFAAKELNDRNGMIWYYLAAFAQQLGELSIKDTGFSAIKAIEFTYDEAEKLRIAGEFSKEIETLTYN